MTIEQLWAIPTMTPHHELITRLCTEISVRRYLEIGVQEGKSLTAALESGAVTQVTLIDPWTFHEGGTGRGSDAHIRELLKDRGFTGTQEIYSAISSEVLPVLMGGRRRFDLCHIDGDHSFDGAYHDLMQCSCLTDWIVIHDTHWPDVRSALVKFLRESPDWEAKEFPLAEGTVVVWRVGALQ